MKWKMWTWVRNRGRPEVELSICIDLGGASGLGCHPVYVMLRQPAPRQSYLIIHFGLAAVTRNHAGTAAA